MRPFLSVGGRTALALLALLTVGCGGRSSAAVDTRLAGDWDYYVTLGAAPSGGFEARRRMGIVHFVGPSADGAWLKRRSGAALNPITKVTLAGTDLMLSLGDGQEIRATVNGDTISGQIHRGGTPINRVWLAGKGRRSASVHAATSDTPSSGEYTASVLGSSSTSREKRVSSRRRMPSRPTTSPMSP